MEIAGEPKVVTDYNRGKRWIDPGLMGWLIFSNEASLNFDSPSTAHKSHLCSLQTATTA